MSDFLSKQMEARQRAWSEAKALLDQAAAENRDLTAEERQSYDRINADLDQRAQLIKDVQDAERREAEIAESMRGLEAVVRPAEARAEATDEDSIIRAMLRGEVRSHTFGVERRDVLTTSTGAPVPKTFSGQVIDQARLVGPMLDPNVVTVLNTAGGEDYILPGLSAFSTATIKAESVAIDESDPVFASTTLKAFKYSFLVQVSSEMIADSNADILGFIARQAGNELGYRANSLLTTGTGTVQPLGIQTAAGTGVTGATAVTGAFTADNLIDLVYSVDGAARRLPGFAVMANGVNIAAMRKLKTSGGDYVFVPTLQPGTPDTILGYPLVENPHMSNAGTGVKSVIAGHLPTYVTRVAGGIRIDRSDEYAFSADLTTLRFVVRVDGALPQQSHVKAFRGGTA